MQNVLCVPILYTYIYMTGLQVSRHVCVCKLIRCCCMGFLTRLVITVYVYMHCYIFRTVLKCMHI